MKNSKFSEDFIIRIVYKYNLAKMVITICPNHEISQPTFTIGREIDLQYLLKMRELQKQLSQCENCRRANFVNHKVIKTSDGRFAQSGFCLQTPTNPGFWMMQNDRSVQTWLHSALETYLKLFD